MAYIGGKIGNVASEMDPGVLLGVSVGQFMCSVLRLRTNIISLSFVIIPYIISKT